MDNCKRKQSKGATQSISPKGKGKATPPLSPEEKLVKRRNEAIRKLYSRTCVKHFYGFDPDPHGYVDWEALTPKKI